MRTTSLPRKLKLRFDSPPEMWTCGQRALISRHRLDEVDAVIVVLLDPRRDREDVGIEDDVLGRKADPDEQLIRALADLDLALLGVGLADLVERHDDDRGAIRHALARMLEELLLAFLHADRIDDRLARDALQPRLDHVPFRAVDHHRHARDVGLGGDQLEEGGHGLVRVEQAFVHVDVDHLRAVLDLLARDFDRLGIIARHDQLLERRRSGDVGALADIDEIGRGGGGVHKQSRSFRAKSRNACSALGPVSRLRSKRTG